MEEDLVARLTGDAGIGALVSDRVSWFERSRGDAAPSLVLIKVSPGREWTHEGPDGLDRPRVQIDCYAAEDVTALALARLVLALLEEAAEVGTTRFHPAMLDGERFVAEGEQDGGEGLFVVQLDFLFYHEGT